MSVCLVALPFMFAADATAELLQRRKARGSTCEDRYDEVLTERRVKKSPSSERTSKALEAIQAYIGSIYAALGLTLVIASLAGSALIDWGLRTVLGSLVSQVTGRCKP